MQAETLDKLAALIQTAHQHKETYVPTIVLPDNAGVHSMEQYQDRPTFMRAQFRTARPGDFTEYLKAENQGADTRVFIEPEAQSAVAVIDNGTHTEPLWGRHRATLRLKKTAEFAGLLDACNQALSQRDLIEFFEDYAHIVTPHHGDEPMSIPEAIHAIRKVDIKAEANAGYEENDFQRQRTSMEKIEAKAANNKMPGRVVMLAEPYTDTGVREIEARITLSVTADKPTFRMRIIGMDRMQRAIATEIENRILDNCPEDVGVYIGLIGD